MNEAQALEEVRAALTKLGVDPGLLRSQRRERVYNELVAMWKNAKSPPMVMDLAERCDLNRNTVYSDLRKLRDEGRVVSCDGAWVPIDL